MACVCVTWHHVPLDARRKQPLDQARRACGANDGGVEMIQSDAGASSAGDRIPGSVLRLRPGWRAALLSALAVAALAAAPSAGASTITSTSGPVYEGLRYGPSYGEHLDVFESLSRSAPIVILIHGGGWRTASALSKYASESKALQAQGFTVFDIQYIQDSTTRPAFPYEPNDVMLATRWAIANAAKFHADPTNVVLLGGSAGGQLAAVAAEQLDKANPGTVRAVVSLSGPMNLASMWKLIENGEFTSESFIYSLEQALGRLPGETVFSSESERQAYPAAWSPALHVASQGCPKWLLFHSQEEAIPLSQAQEMASALSKAGCGVSLQVVPGAKHSFAYWGSVASTIFSFIHSN
jgi:acetyl esterase/lipase